MTNKTEQNYHLAVGLKDCMDDLDFKCQHPNELRGIRTGYDTLDAKLDGLKAGEVTIIGARPAMGKTSFAINLCYNIAAGFYAKQQQNKEDNRCVVYIGLQYTPKEFAQKCLALQARLPFYQLRDGNVLNENFEKICQAERALNALPLLYVHDVFGADDIAQKLRHIQKEKQIGCVFVDYLQLLGEAYQAREDYHLIMAQMKALAVEFCVPVVILSQLNRALEVRIDKRPLCADIRGFCRNQNAADNILFLYREIYYINYFEPCRRKNEAEKHYQHRIQKWQERCREVKNLCEIIIAKNANGYYGSVNMYFDFATGLFAPWEVEI